MRNLPLRRAFAAAAIVATALLPAAALATHPVVPTLLRQNLGSGTGQTIQPGSIHPSGTDVFITATMPGATNGTGFYDVELEIAPAGSPFTNNPTHSAGVLNGSKSTVDVEAVGLVFQPTNGAWKWQARMRSGSSQTSATTSAWVQFNGGATAFEIAPPTVPDILLDSVTVVMSPNPGPNSLELTATGVFRNRGAVPTGNFQWRVWLSTTPNLSGTTTLLWTSTTPLNLAASGTQTVSSDLITISPRPPPGAYYVVIEADPHATPGCTSNCGQVSEFDELNNIRATANHFINGTDLVAGTISTTATSAQPGSTVNFSVNMFNQGTDAAVDAQGQLIPVTFRIVASRTANITHQDQVVYSNTLTFAGGQTHNLNIPVTLPAGVLGGDVTWGLVLDPQNQVIEALESNNLATTSTQTTVSQADLEMVSVDLVDVVSGVSRRTGDFGQQARFRITLKNVGNFPSIPVHAGVVLSKDNNLSLIFDQLFADSPLPGLAVNASATHDITVTLPVTDKQSPPQPWTTGDYHFFVTLDSFNVIHELNESNNTGMVSGPVRLRTPEQDYAMARVRTAAQTAAGDTLFIERQIRNVGTSSGQPTEYACYASANDIITPQDFALHFVEPDGTTVPRRSITLGLNGSDQRTETVRVPGLIPAGSYYVGCIVDPDGALSELSKTNNTATTQAPVTVAGQAFQIGTIQVPDATVGQSYLVRLNTVQAPGPVTWTAGTVAPGLSVTATGELTGTPTEIGIYTFRVTAMSGRFIAERVLTVRALPTTTQLVVTTQNLPPVVNDTSRVYQAQLSAIGGSRPYAWTVVQGTLPNGLTLDAQSGLISGSLKPGVANGETNVTVRVRGALGAEATRQLRIRVLPAGALAIGSLALPDSMVGQDYLSDLAATMTGGMTLAPPLVWTVSAGNLPPGLVLQTHVDNTTGLVSGKPTVAGTYTFTVQVRDNMGRTDTASYVVTIHSNGVRVTWAQPPAVLAPGDVVDLAFAGSGAGNQTFRFFSGNLPAGLQLSPDGKLTGTVAEEARDGTYNFAVQAEDAIGARGLGSFALEVKAPVAAEGCSSTGGGLGLTALALLAMAGMLVLRRRPAAARVAVRTRK